MANSYDLIIIGAGMAGMTAAIYARRAGKTVLVLEHKAPGGQIINTLKINNYPGAPGISGADLMQKIYHQMNNLGAKIESEEVLSLAKNRGEQNFTVKTDENEYSCGAIIIATGSEDKKLGLPREEELIGRGISFCATCDGALHKDKPVVVVGGGNTALYDALYLADLCEKVYLIHRRDEFRGDKVLVDRLKEKENVNFVLNSIPTKLLGDQKITGLEVENVTTKKTQSLTVSGIFVAVGRAPATEFLKNTLALDPAGYIITNENCETSLPGIFAAGDCRAKTLRQLVTASSDGATAATMATRYLG